MVEPASANKTLIVSRNAAREAFHDSLRLFIGRGRRFTVKQVSNGTGIAVRMIESFMADVDSTDFRKPDLEETLTLASFLGPDFTTELLAPTKQGAYWLPEEGDVPPGQMVADLAEDTARVTRKVVDGGFTRDNASNLHVASRRIMQSGAHLFVLSNRLLAA